MPNISKKYLYSCAVGSYAQHIKYNIKETSHAMGLMPVSVMSKFETLQHVTLYQYLY